jgi:hypothetical protein
MTQILLNTMCLNHPYLKHRMHYPAFRFACTGKGTILAYVLFLVLSSVVYHDTVVKGLILIVYSRSKTFHIYKLVNGKPMKPKLGNFPDMTVEQARTEAIRMLSAISKGEPVHSRALSKPSSLSLGEIFDHYIIDEYAQYHCTTWQETCKSFRRYFGVWWSRSADTITRADVQQHMNTLGKERGHHTANRAFDDLRAVYSWVYSCPFGHLLGFCEHRKLVAVVNGERHARVKAKRGTFKAYRWA